MGHRLPVMPPEKSLARSIVAHGVVSVLVQAAIFIAVNLAWAAGAGRLLPFLAVTVAYHAFLTVTLLLRREDFRVEETGELLARVNLEGIRWITAEHSCLEDRPRVHPRAAGDR